MSEENEQKLQEEKARLERIFEEDRQIQKKREEEESKKQLLENYQKRVNAINKYKSFLDSLLENKPKGIKIRNWFVCFTRNCNELFNTEEEEYKYVNKYYRGQWAFILEKGYLKKAEKDKLEEFAREFGAMDY